MTWFYHSVGVALAVFAAWAFVVSAGGALLNESRGIDAKEYFHILGYVIISAVVAFWCLR